MERRNFLKGLAALVPAGALVRTAEGGVQTREQYFGKGETEDQAGEPHGKWRARLYKAATSPRLGRINIGDITVQAARPILHVPMYEPRESTVHWEQEGGGLPEAGRHGVSLVNFKRIWLNDETATAGYMWESED